MTTDIKGDISKDKLAAILKHIECPVCYLPADAPIRTCKNGHILCTPCNHQLIYQNPRKRGEGWCPTCKEYGMTRNLPLENVMREQLGDAEIYDCRFREFGCKARLQFGKLMDHVNLCEYNQELYKCPFCRIHAPMNRYTLVNHIIDDMTSNDGDPTMRLTLIPIHADIDLITTVDSYLASFLDTEQWVLKRRRVELLIGKNHPNKFAIEYYLHNREWELDESITITVYEAVDISGSNFGNQDILREDNDIYTNCITLLFDIRQIYVMHFAANTLPASIKYTAGYLNPYFKPDEQKIYCIRLMLDMWESTTTATTTNIESAPTQPRASALIMQKRHIKNTITINHKLNHIQYGPDDDTGFYHRFKNTIITDRVCSPTAHHSVLWRLIYP